MGADLLQDRASPRRLVGLGLWVTACLLNTASAGDGLPAGQASVVVGGASRVVVPAQACAVPAAPRPLGTFYPQPYMTVVGTGMAGGGYAPLGMYGNVTLSEYGPLSAFRRVAAPVDFYSRGYNGQVVPMSGVGFSYPNMPPASNVIYPTRGNYNNAFPTSGTPPFWDSTINWIDQN